MAVILGAEGVVCDEAGNDGRSGGAWRLRRYVGIHYGVCIRGCRYCHGCAT